MNQIGWEQNWLTIIKDYIGPMVTKNFMGYYTDVSEHVNIGYQIEYENIFFLYSIFRTVHYLESFEYMLMFC